MLAGLAFLNMSFVTMEIRVLDLVKEYKTLAQLVANAGMEEERDACGESETSESAKEADLPDNFIDICHSFLGLMVQNKRSTTNDSISDLSHLETFCPPPEA